MKLYRSKKGGSIVEFGPSVWIIVVMILVPSIDFCQIGLAYACGWWANHVACHEAAAAGPTNATAAANSAVAAWMTYGIGTFTHSPTPTNVVKCPMGAALNANSAQGSFCEVTTTVKVTPIIPFPWLTANQVTFVYDNIDPIEETGQN